MKSTKEFENEIVKASNFFQFLEANSDEFIYGAFHDYLVMLMDEKGHRRGELIKDSQISKDYAYQIFSGKRRPSRDKVIQLSLALKIEIDEANKLLKLAGHSVLYGKIKRDACIIFAIANGFDIDRTNNLLFDAGEPTLIKQ